MSPTPAVEAHGLCLNYGTRKALDQLSFEAMESERLGFLGPNGGGKSSLFKILAGLQEPHQGSFKVMGWNLEENPADFRKSLGLVFQSPGLDSRLTVDENLRIQGQLYGLSGRKLSMAMDECLESLDIRHRGGELVDTLSGGLARRAEIAKALIHKPSVLLLDEPSTGLDPSARLGLSQALSSLRSRLGTTILLTTHILEEAELCDRVGLLDQGRLVALDSPGALISQIKGGVLWLKSSLPEALEKALSQKGLDPRKMSEGILRLVAEDPHDLAKKISEEHQDILRSVTVGQPTLEDVFIQQTGHALERP